MCECVNVWVSGPSKGRRKEEGQEGGPGRTSLQFIFSQPSQFELKKWWQTKANQWGIQFVDLPAALAQARAGGRRKDKREGQEGQAYSSSSASPPNLTWKMMANKGKPIRHSICWSPSCLNCLKKKPVFLCRCMEQNSLVWRPLGLLKSHQFRIKTASGPPIPFFHPRWNKNEDKRKQEEGEEEARGRSRNLKKTVITKAVLAV